MEVRRCGADQPPHRIRWAAVALCEYIHIHLHPQVGVLYITTHKASLVHVHYLHDYMHVWHDCVFIELTISTRQQFYILRVFTRDCPAWCHCYCVSYDPQATDHEGEWKIVHYSSHCWSVHDNKNNICDKKFTSPWSYSNEAPARLRRNKGYPSQLCTYMVALL